MRMAPNLFSGNPQLIHLHTNPMYICSFSQLMADAGMWASGERDSFGHASSLKARWVLRVGTSCKYPSAGQVRHSCLPIIQPRSDHIHPVHRGLRPNHPNPRLRTPASRAP